MASEKIDLKLNIQVQGGPAVDASDVITVEAYEKLGVEVAAGATTSIALQPGGAGKVKFLYMTADSFNPAVTWSVDGGATTIRLDRRVLLYGAGPVDDLLRQPPQTLDVKNGTGNAVTLSVLLGRDF